MLNQENKADNGKHDPTLLMHDLGKALKAVTAVLNYGAEKYEPRGWKTVEPRRYQSALLRHYNDYYVMGELTDSESGLLHLAHKATNALFLLQLYIENVEKSSKTLPDFYTYKKPPQNHKKNKAPEITGTVLAPGDTFIVNCPDYTQVGDYQFPKECEKQAIQLTEDAFELPKARTVCSNDCYFNPDCGGACPYGR
jgi:hypothetical protein